jgi:hypothetical protein
MNVNKSDDPIEKLRAEARLARKRLEEALASDTISERDKEVLREKIRRLMNRTEIQFRKIVQLLLLVLIPLGLFGCPGPSAVALDTLDKAFQDMSADYRTLLEKKSGYDADTIRQRERALDEFQATLDALRKK